MRSKIVTVLAAAFSLGVVQAASAADMPVKAPIVRAPVVMPFSWTGLYVGANAGAAWIRDCFTYQSGSSLGLDDGCQSASSFIGGGQIGFNWQTGTWVFGIEGSGDWAKLESNAVSPSFGGDTIYTKTDSLFLATVRAGYAWDRYLAYVKGGAAFVPSDYWRNFTGSSTTFATASETRIGWTVGAGLEYAFLPSWPNWSAAVEYDYIGGGTRTITQTYTGGGCVGGVPCNEDIKQDVQMVTLRLNYRFNWMHP